ncbi:uncharacterized protein LOC123309057 [Coccinella septempunctata]|uniref:uncharacterized protein LOC123309057 n=1 Tax=Coccinella septempunctata TaxID=41139 RepID=UPI001D08E352|nr:uncharacterized protein LOC123309057 [Coccinella septempunctata]
MSKTRLILQQYKKDVMNLVECAKEINSRNDQEKIFAECFYSLNKNEQFSPSRNSLTTSLLRRILNLYVLLFILAISIYILLNVHQPTSSLVLRNVQGFIYPGLKFLRILSVPIIKKLPLLTGLYDESCLIENPYFYVHEMECWPCYNVYSFIEITGTQNQSTYSSGIPHITKTSHKPVHFDDLKDIYDQNKYYFHKESGSIRSSSNSVTNLEELFSQNVEALSSSDIHVSWRINRMLPARIMRSVFPKPESLSERSGQSVERFIFIDGAKAHPYMLPGMECSYISVRQAIGQRTIVLKPSAECSKKCRTVSLVLNSSVILWYNWWYWRPVSLPIVNATDLAISYISSYC